MNFSSEELKYLHYVLSTTSSYIVARGEQIDHPSVNHKKLQQKIIEQLGKIHWK
tara:strand:- start:1857 stop:2018 length:162 start_codon:yes stop_codon:yes gene_type:complete